MGQPTLIRWMVPRDLDGVVSIDRRSFAENPWTGDDFLEYLRASNCIAMISEIGDTVVGYMIYELHRNHLKLAALAVDPDHRRQSVATDLVEKLFYKVEKHHRAGAELIVGDDNYAAQALFKKCGFRAVSVVKDYYGPRDDGYRMRWANKNPSTVAVNNNRISTWLET